MDELDELAILRLKRIVKETEAKIVLSSSWRWDKKAYCAVKQQLFYKGLEIFDTTIMDIRRNMSRTGEIQLYLDEHSEVENYVILENDHDKFLFYDDNTLELGNKIKIKGDNC